MASNNASLHMLFFVIYSTHIFFGKTHSLNISIHNQIKQHCKNLFCLNKTNNPNSMVCVPSSQLLSAFNNLNLQPSSTAWKIHK